MTYTLINEEKEETRELNNETTINDLLKDLELSPQTVVVKKNDQIVTEDANITNGDTIRIIQIIYGG